MISGLVLNEEIHWVSFHGIYDFAYLLKAITNLPLPETENLFFENLKMYFPHYYDIRYLVRYTDNLRGSLSKLGQELNINRIGIQHQAGSDSIITSEIFFKLKSEYFSDDLIKSDKNVLFGLGVGTDEGEFQFSNANTYYPNYYNNTNNKTINNNFNTGNNFDFSNSFYPQSLINMQYPYLRNTNTTSYFPNTINVIKRKEKFILIFIKIK
jgi:CCR4-NOT transcription complex subunit 7/8